MVKSLKEAVIARYRKGSEKLEILVDLEKALQYREGKIKNIEEVLIYEEIFKDAKKGERAGMEDLKRILGTTDLLEAINKILKEGEIQITTEYKRKLIEEKKRQIISIIHKNAIDPRTKLPHPIERIESALSKAKVNIDPFKPIEMQLDEIIKKLKLILPLKFEKVKLAFRIYPEYAGRAMSFVKRKFKVLKEEWASDGSWIFLLEVPIGEKEEVISYISKICEGNLDVKEIK